MITIQSPKFHLLLLLTRSCIFFLLIPCATPLTFSFPTFQQSDTNTRLITEGDAVIDNQLIRLTQYQQDDKISSLGSFGRATYYQPFRLRESTTGKLADFTTHFRFVIDSQNKTPYADGLTFFLAPNGSMFNRTLVMGGSLGLPMENLPGDMPTSSQYPFFAVEFDIYTDKDESIKDPEEDHVGIDINSLKSKRCKPWNGGILEGKQNSAKISYNSTSKVLGVTFTSFENGTQVLKTLYHTVNLTQYLPDLVIAGFSASSATSGVAFALHKIVSWDFNSTYLHDYETNTNSTSNSILMFVALGAGGGFVLVCAFGFVWFIMRKRSKRGENIDERPMANMDWIDNDFEKQTGPRKFSYNKLARATSNFAEREKLGEGGFGGVYKGFIKDLNSYVAVKRISKRSRQGLKEYASEVTVISRLKHRNLVQLIGWCHEKRELLLVYDFMPNGSLDFHLFRAKALLVWEVRYKIVQGLACGLFYLHQGWEQCVLHRDIKSSNVMLDANFTAKLGDFGLARLVDHGKQSKTTTLAGTMGYMAPEYVTTGKASKEFDVYSFGVVALEIACGRQPIDFSKFESIETSMVEWVWELYGEGKVLEAADPKLCGDFDAKQMECLMIVGLWCAHPNYNMRPSIQQAIQVLNFEVPLPILPPIMPVPMAPYFAPWLNVSHVVL